MKKVQVYNVLTHSLHDKEEQFDREPPESLD